MRRSFGSDLRRVHGLFVPMHDTVIDAILDIGTGRLGGRLAKTPKIRLIVREEDFRRVLAIEPASLVIIVFEGDNARVGRSRLLTELRGAGIEAPRPGVPEPDRG